MGGPLSRASRFRAVLLCLQIGVGAQIVQDLGEALGVEVDVVAVLQIVAQPALGVLEDGAGVGVARTGLGGDFLNPLVGGVGM